MANEIFSDKHDKDGSPAGHRARVRKKIHDNGFDSLQDYEKVEAMLFYVIPRSDTKPLAIRLVERFGSFVGVLDAPFDELLKVDGCGQSVAFFLNVLAQISQSYLGGYDKSLVCFSNFKEVGDYLIRKFIGFKNERFIILCLNDKNEVLGEEIIDSIDSYVSSVSCKTVTSVACKYNCSKIIIAHNHPQGSFLPSVEDFDYTTKLRDLLAGINISLEEHYVISNDTYTRLLN